MAAHTAVGPTMSVRPGDTGHSFLPVSPWTRVQDKPPRVMCRITSWATVPPRGILGYISYLHHLKKGSDKGLGLLTLLRKWNAGMCASGTDELLNRLNLLSLALLFGNLPLKASEGQPKKDIREVPHRWAQLGPCKRCSSFWLADSDLCKHLLEISRWSSKSLQNTTPSPYRMCVPILLQTSPIPSSTFSPSRRSV